MVRRLTDKKILQQAARAAEQTAREMQEPWWPQSARILGEGTATRVEVRTCSGARIQFPIRWFDELAGATREQLSEVEVVGEGICWEELDVQLSFPGLLVQDVLGLAFVTRQAAWYGEPSEGDPQLRSRGRNGLEGSPPDRRSA